MSIGEDEEDDCGQISRIMALKRDKCRGYQIKRLREQGTGFEL